MSNGVERIRYTSVRNRSRKPVMEHERMVATKESITRLLNAAGAGDAASSEELLSAIYEELRAMARHRLRNTAPGATLQPTDLVHEAYLRLFETQATWNSRGHFFAAAAQAMRNILVDQARKNAAVKRGGAMARVELNEENLAIDPPSDDVLALDEMLGELERSQPRKARLVLLHCFGGLTLEETAAAMDVSLATVERDWRFTRALLHTKLEE
jgi:RNA polymerase sigma factor (TIGR02999 family)